MISIKHLSTVKSSLNCSSRSNDNVILFVDRVSPRMISISLEKIISSATSCRQTVSCIIFSQIIR